MIGSATVVEEAFKSVSVWRQYHTTDCNSVVRPSSASIFPWSDSTVRDQSWQPWAATGRVGNGIAVTRFPRRRPPSASIPCACKSTSQCRRDGHPELPQFRQYVGASSDVSAKAASAWRALQPRPCCRRSVRMSGTRHEAVRRWKSVGKDRNSSG